MARPCLDFLGVEKMIVAEAQLESVHGIVLEYLLDQGEALVTHHLVFEIQFSQAPENRGPGPSLAPISKCWFSQVKLAARTSWNRFSPRPRLSIREG